MKIVIFEGIASSGKTTLERLLAEVLLNAKIISEGTTLMPLIDNRDPQIALHHLIEVVQQLKKENVDWLVIDRFHLTHAFRTSSSLENFASVEAGLKKLGNVLIVLLTIEPKAIKDRIEETMDLRKDAWKRGAQGSLEERVAYYTKQQEKLKDFIQETTLRNLTIDTTDKKWGAYVSEIQNVL